VRLLVVFAVLTVTASQCAFAYDTTPTFEDTRRVSLFMSIGALEIANLGVNIQLSEQYSVGMVASKFILGGPGYLARNATTGVGLRGSYYFARNGEEKFLWANVIAVDLQYLFLYKQDEKLSLRNPGGIGFEGIVGRDGIIGPGVGVLWGVGVAASFHSEEPPLVFPAFRVGLHVDI
jgi:hypothetical protein